METPYGLKASSVSWCHGKGTVPVVGSPSCATCVSRGMPTNICLCRPWTTSSKFQFWMSWGRFGFGLSSPFPKALIPVQETQDRYGAPPLIRIYNCSPFPSRWTCFLLAGYCLQRWRAHYAHAADLFSLFACCYLGSKHLCVSEHIKTSSKKCIMKNSVLIRQPPFEVLWQSCGLCMCLGI